jgi:2-polyprenyl-3-methyl-5-hydroxy-6-metoxy-1,4-benzoquinol methylase
MERSGSFQKEMNSVGTAAAAQATRLEQPACPLCRSEQREFPFELPDGYRVARCQECRTHYLYPRLTEEAMQLVYQDPSYYQGGHSGYADTSYFDQETALRATFRSLLRNLEKRGMTGGDLFEVGCGYGYLLDEARPYFRRRVGTECSPEAAALARATGAEVFVGGLEQLASNASFDCALAIQVIEHIYEPVRFMEQLVAHVKPGGYVVLATPDIGGALRKLMGQSWPSFKVPEHVLYFDFDSLRKLMREAGLVKISRMPYPHAFPLGLIAAKFGLSLPGALARINLWVPATTIAVSGVVAHD